MNKPELHPSPTALFSRYDEDYNQEIFPTESWVESWT